jgi:hypothetical protein
MNELTLAGFLLILLFIFLGSGIWVAFSLLGTGLAAMFLFTSAPVALSLPQPHGAAVTVGHWQLCPSSSGWVRYYSDHACPKTCFQVCPHG